MTPAGLSSLLPLPVVIPIAGAALAPLAARWSKRLAFSVCIITTIAATVILALMAHTVFGGHELTHFLGNWAPFSGKQLGDTFAADPLGLAFALSVSTIGGLLLIYSLSAALSR